MKRLAIILALSASPASAQTVAVPQPDYRSESLGNELLSCMQGKVGVGAQVLALQAENAALKKQVDALKLKDEKKDEAKP